MRKIPLFVIQNANGQPHKGVILEKSQVRDLIPPNKYKISFFSKEKCGKSNTVPSLAKSCLSMLDHDFAVFLGGDHSTSFSTILASLKKYGPECRILWIDAHADIHSPETSPSGNEHGMPARFLMTHSFADIPRLKPNQIMYLGLRSVESEEWDFIHRKKIRYITAETFLKDPLDAYAKIRRFVKDRPLHLSLDVDSLDPSIMKSTGTAETGGLSFDHLERIWNDCLWSADFFAMDIMEYNPEIGRAEEKRVSKDTMRSIFEMIAKETT
jgi:arginase